MSATGRLGLGAADVIQITSNLERDDAAFIIGGQATNLWAWFYRVRHADLSEPLTSEDIDFFGSVESARRFSEAIGGKLLLPERASATPSTAIVKMTIGGREITIDFLNDVLGVSQRELQKGVSEIALHGEDANGRDVEVHVRLLHPVMCLKSRVASILSPATRRGDAVALRQLSASAIIVRCFIHDALASGEREDWREARRCFSSLFGYIRSHEYGRRAHLDTPVDILDLIKAFACDEQIEARYRHNQLNLMVEMIEKRRASMQRRLAKP
jgi:hypothetical protein